MPELPIVLVRASGDHWFDLTDPDRPEICHVPLPQGTSKGVSQLAVAALGDLPRRLGDAEKANIYYDGYDVLAVESAASGWFGLAKPPAEWSLRGPAMGKAFRFRTRTKDQLITALSSEVDKSSTEAILEAFRQYTFFDGYACWLYNSVTKCFTKIASSSATNTDVLKESDCPIFSQVIRTPEAMMPAQSECSTIPGFDEHDSRSVQLFATSTSELPTSSSQLTAIVCMFSRKHNYQLRAKTVNLIRGSLAQSLAERYFNRIIHLNEIRASVRAMREIDNLPVILNEVCKLTAQQFQWQACSIYLKDIEEPTQLKRTASFPLDDANASAGGSVYGITSVSLTAEVYRSGSPQWSYDIENDPRNSHTFDDKILGHGKNWIGVPIIAQDTSEVLGVLRVKNRVQSHGEEENFIALDLANLQSVAYDLSSIINQYQRYAERKAMLEMRAREVRELKDFQRTFTHEIKTPVQTICFAPDRLKLTLRELGMIRDLDDVPPKLRDYLADLRAIGSRLEMLAKALTLDPEHIVRELVRCSLYKDCIAPVLAFAEPHARKRGKRLWYSKDALGVMLTCDATAVSIAFHVLIDNAIKYSDKDTTIRIFGQRSERNRFVVYVESSSDIFGIEETEEDRIFEKYQRGSAAARQKMEGSGIGLFLASRIAELHGGKVSLMRRVKPITFAMELPI